MMLSTRKHFSVGRGLAKSAQVTVGRVEHLGVEGPPPEPQIYLSDHPLLNFSDNDREVIEAARRGVRETEIGLGWQGRVHFVVKIEGLEVDGIDANAACLAAGEATKNLIERGSDS